jgi:hypothetical protein
MLQRRALGAAVALLLVAAACSHHTKSEISNGGPTASASAPSGSPTSSGAPAATGVNGSHSSAAIGGQAILPGLTGSGGSSLASCKATPSHEIGVTNTSITIGEVVTDSNSLPQQLGPVHEGLEAFVNVFNKAGGLCGRKLNLEYRNDNLNPATHSSDTQDLANKSLAFVGNDSLLDFLDYGRNPPFDPTVKGGGSFVPDVGGLAFAYGRAQSNWHAGVIGSVSPVLVGGGQFKQLTAEVSSQGHPCRKGGVVYLNEPTGASKDQASLGAAAVEASWGGGLGSGNTKMYEAELTDQNVNYQGLVTRMVSDGMNCVWAYTDLQGSIRLVTAMHNGGYWPPNECTQGNKCFRVAWVPFTVYDSKFIKDGGAGALGVSTFIPHVPLSESSEGPVKTYQNALKTVSGARPSTFSIFGFTSGLMFVQALEGCASAPTRTCLIDALRKMQDFNGGGLLGGTTPFKRTKASFGNYGDFAWKWIFNRSVGLRVEKRGSTVDFYRINPSSGFLNDTLHVARGTPG